MGDGSVTIGTYTSNTVFIDNCHVSATVVLQSRSPRFHSINGTRHFLLAFIWKCNLWCTHCVRERVVGRVTGAVRVGVDVHHGSFAVNRRRLGRERRRDRVAAHVADDRQRDLRARRARGFRVRRAVHRRGAAGAAQLERLYRHRNHRSVGDLTSSIAVLYNIFICLAALELVVVRSPTLFITHMLGGSRCQRYFRFVIVNKEPLNTIFGRSVGE